MTTRFENEPHPYSVQTPCDADASPSREPRVDACSGHADVNREVAAFASMTSRELAAKYEQLVGAPSRSRNREFLMRRVAVIVQARRDGWLSAAAKAKIRELGGEVWVPPGLGDREAPAAAEREVPAVAGRDPRLPPVGSVLRRVHAGRTYTVEVLAEGFALEGVQFATLTEVARTITGRKWNGYEFFKVALAGSSRSPKLGDLGRVGATDVA